ncbi:MAG: sugar phosphate nucleotidyltransferase [Thiobacillus sp.]
MDSKQENFMQNLTWVVVLAAGDGKRLAGLTTDHQGRHVPKQFCSLQGGPSLFGLALARARALVPEDRVCAVVAKAHEHWWQPTAQAMQAGNLIVQPRNRGTGNGVLLALTYILKRDPQARLIFLPADHHVLSEATLIQAMLSSLADMPASSREIFLLGIEPDDADPELGYIIPQKTAKPGAQGVRHFIEKPSRAVAGKLIQEGGLWNSGVFAVSGDRLLELFQERFPANVFGIKTVLDKMADPISPSWALNHLYERIPEVDFSHQVLQFHVGDLRVVPVPHCGWTDLGSSQRVGDRVRLLTDASLGTRDTSGNAACLDLADAVIRADRSRQEAFDLRSAVGIHKLGNNTRRQSA